MINYISSFLYKPEESAAKEASVSSKPIIGSTRRENDTATLIQKCFRGHQERKGYLLTPSYSDYKQQVSQTEFPKHGMPRAQGGSTTVYLPKEMPEIVLKQSGRKDAITRFHQMQEIRSILSSQQSSHLIIPKAALCEYFLVEQRLPININRFHNMGLYTAEPSLFDNAVREMTRLFSRVHLSDLVSSQETPSNNIVGDTVRYDNLPLYVEEKNGKREGKIGLIDLEHMKNKPHNNSSYYGLEVAARMFSISTNYCGLSALARIFPYHKDLIIEEATKLNVSTSWLSLSLDAYRGDKYLQEAYVKHRNYLTEKGISSATAMEIFEVEEGRMNQLIDIVEKELLKLNRGQNDLSRRANYPLGHTPPFLGENTQKEAKDLAIIIAPQLIENIKKAIKEKQEYILNTQKTPIKSESEIVALRSLVLNQRDIYEETEKLLEELPLGIRRKMYNSAEQLLFVIIEELIKGHELFSFDPGVGADTWLRY